MSELMTQVRQIVARYASNDAALESATASTHMQKDLGISSTNLVDFVLEFEDTFDITIEDDELTQIQTLGDAMALLEKKRGRTEAKA